MTRTSTFTVSTPPTRSNSRSCSTRSSFTCTSAGTSPTSSRNSVPPSASSKRPARRAMAPVNAPFSCPNSSDSSTPGARAAQFTRTNGRDSRGLLMWMARATISLPVPVSPAQQHGGRGLGHLLHLGQHLAQRRRIADDGAEVELAVGLARQHAGVLLQLALQAAVLAQQVEALDGLHDDALQLLAVPGLGHVAVDAAEVDRLDQHLDVGEGGDDDAHRVGADVAQGLQQIQAGHLRHALVGDHHRDVLGPGQLQRLLGAVRQPQREHLAEVEAERVQVVGLVVHHQDGEFAQIQARDRHPETVT